MSDDAETSRECRVCRALNRYSALYCGNCGASMARSSGAMPLLSRIVTDALVQLADVGLDSEGLSIQHGLREVLTAIATWKDRPPEEEERGTITDRAVNLSIAAGDYSQARRR